MNIALPMFMLSVGLPIGLQCDKFVISHRLPARALSEYALCSQLYAPSWLVMSAAAFSLLPVFTRRRAKGLPHRQLWSRLIIAFGLTSMVLGAAFTLAAPFLARLITSGRVHIGLDLRLAFAALLVVQTTGLVSAMVLNRPAEMRIQAYCVVAMMVSNVALSWVFAGHVGVAGPVIASALTVGLLMTLPSGIRAARSREFSPTAEGLPVSLG
jgi:O-antigen/teichoic acid export membrane protein